MISRAPHHIYLGLPLSSVGIALLLFRSLLRNHASMMTGNSKSHSNASQRVKNPIVPLLVAGGGREKELKASESAFILEIH
jgi:hypothetical protein